MALEGRGAGRGQAELPADSLRTHITGGLRMRKTFQKKKQKNISVTMEMIYEISTILQPDRISKCSLFICLFYLAPQNNISSSCLLHYWQ